MNARPLPLFAVLAVSLTWTGNRAAAENYAVDPSHTFVLFSTGHLRSAADPRLPVSYTYGQFRKLEGSFVLDRTNPAGCQFQFAIDVASLDTNDSQRDQHLKGPDFFNARQFPQITFQSTACQLSQRPDGKLVYDVTGNITMLGQTRQVTLPLEWVGEADGPYGNHRVGLHSQFTIKRSDFGMAGMPDLVGDAVGITVNLEGIRQEDSGVRPAAAISPE